MYGLQRRINAAENIYAHRWVQGDVVIFHNRGTLHSITGQLAQYKADKEKKRLLWQCTMTSTTRREVEAGVCTLFVDLYRKLVSKSGLQKHIFNYSPVLHGTHC